MNFLFTARFIKIAFTSAILFVLLDFLWLAFIAASWHRQTPRCLAEPDPQCKNIFNIPFGSINVVWGTLQGVLAGINVFYPISISVNQSSRNSFRNH